MASFVRPTPLDKSQGSRNLRYTTILYYAVPMLFCLVVHWTALRTWFYGDDFAWLGLRLELNTPRDLIHIFFRPEAQGTVRVLSERLFFLVFYSVFGLHAPPFHIWAFLTQFANIFLLIEITRRLTGSTFAGFLAPILWSGNAAFALALGWSSAYNEICFAFFILLAFYLFLRYTETGQSKYWIWQWVAFLLGFGALELNVMYPVLAAGYALCCARAYFRRTLLLFVPSVLFTAAHFIFIPSPTDPYYRMYFGLAPLQMLWTYWEWTFSGVRHPKVDWRPEWLSLLTVLAITVALAFFTWRKLKQKQWLAIFLLGWFFVAIAPVLPLKNHFTEYYVTVPSIGLAILSAWAIAQSRGFLSIAAAVLAGLYLLLSFADIRSAERFGYVLAHNVKYLVLDVEQLPKQQKIMFAGIDNDLFWSALYPNPWRLIGVSDVYLVPGSEKGIDPHPEWGGLGRYTISPLDALLALKTHRGVVVQLDNRTLRDVTALYLPRLEQQVGREVDFVDVIDPRYADRAGPGWYPPEAQFRWMGKVATVKIDRPSVAGQALKVTGFTPGILLAQGPLQVTFRAGDAVIGDVAIKNPNQAFAFDFPLPSQLIGTGMMDVQIEVNRTVQVPNDPRSFGLVFGTFTLH